MKWGGEDRGGCRGEGRRGEGRVKLGGEGEGEGRRDKGRGGEG